MYRAADILVDAPIRWESLFEKDFKVCPVASSKAIRNPLDQNPRSAELIIRRMTNDQEMIDTYTLHAASLEERGYKLEEGIKKGARAVHPLVHSEILLADWLEKKTKASQEDPPQFFNEWKYIGTSKQTCKLCAYYFQETEGDKEEWDKIQVRPSHQNVYLNWRMPDVFNAQGNRKRNGVMHNILEKIRSEVFRLFRDQVSEWRKHDSATGTALARLVGPQRRDGTDLSTSMASLSLSDRPHRLERTLRYAQEGHIAAIPERDEEERSPTLSEPGRGSGEAPIVLKHDENNDQKDAQKNNQKKDQKEDQKDDQKSDQKNDQNNGQDGVQNHGQNDDKGDARSD